MTGHRIPHPRATGGRRRRPRGDGRRRPAARAVGGAAPARRRNAGRRPAGRRAVGCEATADGRQDRAGLHLAAARALGAARRSPPASTATRSRRSPSSSTRGASSGWSRKAERRSRWRPGAARVAERALALWRGAPLSDFAYEPFAQRRSRGSRSCASRRSRTAIEADLALAASGAGRRARAPRRASTPARAAARPAHARAVPRRPPGRRAGRLPRRAPGARRGARASSRAASCGSSSARSSTRTRLGRDARAAAAAAPAVRRPRRRSCGSSRPRSTDALAARGGVVLLGGRAGHRQDPARRRAGRDGARARRARALGPLLGGRRRARVLAVGAVAARPRAPSRRTLRCPARARRRGAGRAAARARDASRHAARRLRPNRGRALPALRCARRVPPCGASRAARPLVLVLDDLHAADEPSLLLLRFVARQLADAGSARRRLPRRRATREPARWPPLVAQLARERAPTRSRCAGSPRRRRPSTSSAATGRGAAASSATRSTPRPRATRCSSPSWCGCSPRRAGWRSGRARRCRRRPRRRSATGCDRLSAGLPRAARAARRSSAASSGLDALARLGGAPATSCSTRSTRRSRRTSSAELPDRRPAALRSRARPRRALRGAHPRAAAQLHARQGGARGRLRR